MPSCGTGQAAEGLGLEGRPEVSSLLLGHHHCRAQGCLRWRDGGGCAAYQALIFSGNGTEHEPHVPRVAVTPAGNRFLVNRSSSALLGAETSEPGGRSLSMKAVLLQGYI